MPPLKGQRAKKLLRVESDPREKLPSLGDAAQLCSRAPGSTSSERQRWLWALANTAALPLDAGIYKGCRF